MSVIGIILFVLWVLGGFQNWIYFTISCFFIYGFVHTSIEFATVNKTWFKDALVRLLNDVESDIAASNEHFTSGNKCLAFERAGRFRPGARPTIQPYWPANRFHYIGRFAFWFIGRTLFKRVLARTRLLIVNHIASVEMKANNAARSIDANINQGLLIEASREIARLRDEVPVQALIFYPERVSNGLDRQLGEFEAALSAKKQAIRAKLEPVLAEKRALEGQSEALETVRMLSKAIDQASAAGLEDLHETASKMFSRLQEVEANSLKASFARIKATTFQHESNVDFRRIRADLERIHERATLYRLAGILREAAYWLENFDPLARFFDAFKTSEVLSLQELQDKMQMEKTAFARFLIDWAGPLGITIGDNQVYWERDALSRIIERIDGLFASWAREEKSKLGERP
ncbi:MAG: hypothetical protein JW839_03975 [Candidatus Lokiarchaeota archaeon]|nr:hypothetical protein [Candidatus Lokiarchaeota archaeon]